MSCLIRQTLPGKALEGDIRAGFVINTQLGAGVLSEVKFREVTVKVLFANVLVNTDKATLED